MDDWDRFGLIPRSHCSWRRHHDNGIDIQPDHLSSKFLEALGVPFSISALDDEVLSFNVAELPKA
jgi:hypothetical protein